MAFGDVSLTVNPDGWSGYLEVEGFSVGATYNFGLGVNNADLANARLTLTVTSLGFTGTTPTTRQRFSHGKSTVRLPWPNNASRDESLVGGKLRTRIGFSMPIFAKDKAGGGNSGVDIVATALTGLVINTAGGGQSSNSAASFTVINNSTLPYPRVVGRWAQPGFERWTGDKLVEFVCFHPFGMNGSPVACVAFDCTDGTNSAAQQLSTQMLASSAFPGEANTVWTYSATIPVSALNDASIVTTRARCYPWIGDSTSVLDTDVSANGVAAPYATLTPLMGYLDKGGTKVVYVAVNPATSGTTGTPQASNNPAVARANRYASVATALTAAKAFNNANNGFNTTDNVVLLMQAGNHTAAGTFLGNNTRSWTIIKADTGNGATKAGVVFDTALNQVFTGYLKYEEVSFAATGSAMFRGSATLSQLWLDNTAFGNTAASSWTAWLVAYATRNVFTAGSQNFTGLTSNPVAWALVRGNDCSALTAKTAHSHCMLGNRNVTVNLVPASSSTGPQGNNSVVGWNSCPSLPDPSYFVLDNIVDSSTRGIAFFGNFAERIGGPSAANCRFIADSATNISAIEFYFAHNTIVGARFNSNYLEVGNYNNDRYNWFDLFNFFHEIDIKSDVFQSANRIVTDGVITSGSNIVTSATGNFTAADVGQNISFEQLPNGIATIVSITSGTEVVISANATASATGVTLFVRSYGRNGSRVSNWGWLYGCGVIGTRSRENNFDRESQGINTSIGTVTVVDNRAYVGPGNTGTGNGDYHPATGSTLLNCVPAGGAVIPGDLTGRKIPNNGTGAAGAFQLATVSNATISRRRRMR